MRSRSPTASRSTIWLAAIAAIALSALYIGGPVLGNTLHQELQDEVPISWDSTEFAGDAAECADAVLEPGEVLWHFVHTGTDGSNLPATLYANFETAGDLEADGYSLGGGNAIVMYDIVTGHDTLNSAHDSIEDDNLLNLSHICVGAEQSESESASPSEEESQSEEQSQSEEESQSEEQSVSEAQSVSQTPEESVEAGTGTPSASVPDGAMAFGGSNPLPTVGFGLILLGSLAGLAFANVKSARGRS